MKRALKEEQMDAADLPPETYDRVLRGLSRVNVATLTTRPTLRFLKQAKAADRPFRLLDVGFGDGGMLRALARWAARHGVNCELVGIDLNPKSVATAEALHPVGAPIAYCAGDYAALGGEPWDYVISSLVTHHMDDAQRQAFLRFMEAHAKRGWFIQDLHRHLFAWAGFPVLALLLGVHRIVRRDGQLSIARSFVPGEWHAMLDRAGMADAKVERLFPFRLCVTRIR